MEYNGYTIDSILAVIEDNDSAGNPEGRTEMHSYHVWEVFNALRILDRNRA